MEGPGEGGGVVIGVEEAEGGAEVGEEEGEGEGGDSCHQLRKYRHRNTRYPMVNSWLRIS